MPSHTTSKGAQPVASNTVEPGSSANAEVNKELVERYFDAMERGALDEATEFWATEATN